MNEPSSGAQAQTDLYIISQHATAKTKLTDNNESQKKINGKNETEAGMAEQNNRSGDNVFL